jgi:hypothetical protein
MIRATIDSGIRDLEGLLEDHPDIYNEVMHGREIEFLARVRILNPHFTGIVADITPVNESGAAK